jgi:hypothetical protein
MIHQWAMACACSVIVATALEAAARRQEPTSPFMRPKWTVVDSLRLVDKEVLSALRAHFATDNRLSDRGGPFGATDAVSGKPRRRFILAGRASEGWFVVYEVGGRGHHLVLAVFGANSPPRVIMLAHGDAGVHNDLSGWQVDVEGLRQALEEKRLSTEDPNGPYY